MQTVYIVATDTEKGKSWYTRINTSKISSLSLGDCFSAAIKEIVASKEPHSGRFGIKLTATFNLEKKDKKDE